jgi:Domain of unknown function (DUF4249)
MKNLLFILAILVCISCEEVVTVDLETAAPRLVIDASINWEKGTSGNVQTIKLTATAGYYDNAIPKVSGAIVSVKNSSSTVFDFIEESGSGKYTCNNFKPIIGENYTLTVIHNGQTYTAQEKLMATPAIKDVEQQNDLGLNSDEIGIKVNFIDNTPLENNFYLFRFETTVNAFAEYETYDDQFTQGNVNSWLYSNKKLKKGSEMNFTLYGISETYYNYVSILLSNSRGGGAFQPLPIKVKGNIINQNNKENYALGYFRLSEIDTYDYIVR